MLNRREFIPALTASLALGKAFSLSSAMASPIGLEGDVAAPLGSEDIFSLILRKAGRFDLRLYRQILGAANEFKDGDAIVGVAANNDPSRLHARQLLMNTRVVDLMARPPFTDQLSIWNNRFVSNSSPGEWKNETLGKLKEHLLTATTHEIQAILPGLTSDIIACLVRLMSNQELIVIGNKIFHPLTGSTIGAKGYLGARVQPNSPTDNVEDIRFQVFDAFAYAVGDVLLGTNPVSSDPSSVANVEFALQDILKTFEIDHIIPHCVLSHIDVQAAVERTSNGATEFWFQSIAGNDDANATFDISVEKMEEYAKTRTGRFGLYLETGQGADFTNGHGHGTDMVFHESRKYGFARGLTHTIARAKRVRPSDVWLHLNDVAGFIGPEVFRTREQLVRCCLEDIVMGKLHGLTIGLDVCATLHMNISLDDLDWCLEQIVPANPAYLMALPTKIDPMLGYLTTGFHDHVRLREKFGFRVEDRMWNFFQQLGVINTNGEPTEHFGDPNWVYLQYRRRKNDLRSDEEIRDESRNRLAEIRQRGVFIAEGYHNQPSQMATRLRSEIQNVYEDAKQCIWKEWDTAFIRNIPSAITLSTCSTNRSDYILHPTTGEQLSEKSRQQILQLRSEHADQWDTQIVISEGLNALALMDQDNLLPLLEYLRPRLKLSGMKVAPQNLVINGGRVRAGYRIGELLFGGLTGLKTIIHLIGERPGSGHHTLSAYLTTADGSLWKQPDHVDHNITRVVSGIASTALRPPIAAHDILTALSRSATATF